jgi:hypothetical protein
MKSRKQLLLARKTIERGYNMAGKVKQKQNLGDFRSVYNSLRISLFIVHANLDPEYILSTIIRCLKALLHPSSVREAYTLVKGVASLFESFVLSDRPINRNTRLHGLTVESATVLAQCKRAISTLRSISNDVKEYKDVVKVMTTPPAFEKADDLFYPKEEEIADAVVNLLFKYRCKKGSYQYDAVSSTRETKKSDGGANKEIREVIDDEIINAFQDDMCDMSSDDDPDYWPYVEDLHEETIHELFPSIAKNLIRRELETPPTTKQLGRLRFELLAIPAKADKSRIISKMPLALNYLLDPITTQATKTLKRTPGFRELFAQRPDLVAKRLSRGMDRYMRNKIYSGDMSGATNHVYHHYVDGIVLGLCKTFGWTSDELNLVKMSYSMLYIDDIYEKTEEFDNKINNSGIDINPSKEHRNLKNVVRGTQMGAKMSFVILCLLNWFTMKKGIEVWKRTSNANIPSLRDPLRSWCIHGDDLIVPVYPGLRKCIIREQEKAGFVINNEKSAVSQYGGVFAGSYYRVRYKKVTREVDRKLINYFVDSHKRPKVTETILEPHVYPLTSFKPSILTGSSSTSPKNLIETIDLLNALNKGKYKKYYPVAKQILLPRFQNEIGTARKAGVSLYGPRYLGNLGLMEKVSSLDKNIIGLNWSKENRSTAHETMLKMKRVFKTSLLSEDLSEELRIFYSFTDGDVTFEKKIPKGHVSFNEIEDLSIRYIIAKSREQGNLKTDKKKRYFRKYKVLLRMLSTERSKLRRLAQSESGLHSRRKINERVGDRWLTNHGDNKVRVNGLIPVANAETYKYLHSLLPSDLKRRDQVPDASGERGFLG